MVVKLCCPDVPMTLLDSAYRKIAFLEGVRDRLGVRGLDLVWSRVEELGRGPGSAAHVQFAVILMRALAALSHSLELIDGISAPGTRLITFKGPNWENELAAASREMSRCGWRFDCEVQIPWVRARVLRIVKV